MTHTFSILEKAKILEKFRLLGKEELPIHGR